MSELSNRAFAFSIFSLPVRMAQEPALIFEIDGGWVVTEVLLACNEDGGEIWDLSVIAIPSSSVGLLFLLLPRVFFAAWWM